MYRFYPTFFLVLALFPSACAVHQYAPEGITALPDTGYRVVSGRVYTPPDWPQSLTADVYIPDRQPGSFPAVLLVHGGGWEGRSPQDLANIAADLAGMGFVVFNISYRLAPEYRFPAQLHDLQQAMHWIRTEGDAYQADTARVGAFGYSAGAHLVSLLGVVAGTGHELDRLHGGSATRPGAVVAGGTPSDLRKFPEGRLVPQFLGGRITEIPQVFADASPVYHVHRGSPPFFLYHGTMDFLVPLDHATDFALVLEAQGIPVEIYLLRFRGHFTAFLTSGNAIRAAADFLHRHLGPPGPPSEGHIRKRQI